MKICCIPSSLRSYPSRISRSSRSWTDLVRPSIENIRIIRISNQKDFSKATWNHKIICRGQHTRSPRSSHLKIHHFIRDDVFGLIRPKQENLIENNQYIIIFGHHTLNDHMICSSFKYLWSYSECRDDTVWAGFPPIL